MWWSANARLLCGRWQSVGCRKKAKASSAITVAIGAVKGRIPAIGVGVPMLQAVPSLKVVDEIITVQPVHLVCQLDGRNNRLEEAATAFRQLQEKTGKPVTLEIILPANAPASEEVAAAVRQQFSGVPLGGGMLSYFTELNRKPAPKGLFDFITHSVCPIVHAADDISVMETLEAMPSIIASTRRMIGKSPYHLGPSSIACSDNPYGAAVATNPGEGRVCLSDNDPRQSGRAAHD